LTENNSSVDAIFAILPKYLFMCNL
jgi:hypothetical protein